MGSGHSCRQVAANYTNDQSHGSWEVEVSYGGEADLHRHFNACEKNPGHLKFIPADVFNIDHLPVSFQDNDIVDLIRAVSDLTVRVAVREIDNRVHLGSSNTVSMLKTGSGWVYHVSIFSNSKKKRKCPCKECRGASKPETQFAYIHIKTVNHVVNKNAGPHTTCHLFYNTGGTTDMCSDAVALKGMFDVISDIESDTCQMKHVTHDMELANRLCTLLDQWQIKHETLMGKYGDDALLQKYLSAREHTLTVIVSHPHGYSKHISVGHYTEWKWVKTIWSRYIYNTPTCTGSSGALVFMLGSSKLFDHAHGGKYPGNPQLNYSSYGID